MSDPTNEPCTCGSGRAAGECCRALERRHAAFSERAWEYARTTLGDKLDDAVEEFGSPADEVEAASEVYQFFLPWLLYCWLPEFERDEPLPEGWESGCTIAENYLGRFESEMSEPEQLFVEAAVLEPFSFYRVVKRGPSGSLTLDDMLRTQELELVDPQASRVLTIGDILLACIVALDGKRAFLGLGPTPFPADRRQAIQDMKDAALSGGGFGEVLEDLGPMLIAEYRRLETELRAAAPESPRNEEGHPLALHVISFDVGDADVAFRALRPLDAAPDVELLEEAELDEEGRVVKAHISWTAHADAPMLLANLRLDGPQLTVEVDSRERAERIRSALREHVPGADEVSCEVQSFTDFVRRLRRDNPDDAGPPTPPTA